MSAPRSDSKPVRKSGGDRSPPWLVDQRIAEACAVIAQRPSIHRCELHKLFGPRWLSAKGKRVHWQTVDNLVRRARKKLAERTKRPKDAWIDDLLAGYDRDIGDADAKVRLAARQGIRQMLGLDAPNRTEVSGPDGGAIALKAQPMQSLSDEELERIILAAREKGLLPAPAKQGNGHVV